MFNRGLAILSSITSLGMVGSSREIEALPDAAPGIILFGGGESPRPSRRGSQVAHRRWKRTRAAGITKRVRR